MLGQTVIMVTHPVAASYADSVLFLADGRIVDARRFQAPPRCSTASKSVRSEPS